VLDGRGEDEAGDGVAVGEKGFDEGFKIGEVGGGDLEEEVVAAGKVVALADFFKRLHVVEEAVVVLAGATHADKGDDLEAKGFVVDVDCVSGEDADLFHLTEAFASRGGREADAAR